jgi:NADH:ubiquinone reductase (H+-translocating)
MALRDGEINKAGDTLGRSFMKKVVIVGIGFGGIHAVKGLAGEEVEVLVVDRENYHLFQPLLYQVATAALEQESIAYPVRAMIRRWKNVRFRLAEVCGVDFSGRRLLTSGGAIEYDYLILSAGSVTNFFGMKAVEEFAYDLKRLDHAVLLRSQILGSFEKAARETDDERRKALLSFVIVGGGPTGVEFAGALGELVHFVLSRDYPELPVRECRIVLVEAGDSLLSAFPRSLGMYAVRRLEKLRVEVMLEARVVGAEPGKVHLCGGREIAAGTLFWSSGVTAAPLAGRLGVGQGPQGRVRVEPDLSLPEYPEVYVVGDMAYLEQDGGGLPMVAPVAMQQGDYAARAIVAREAGRRLPPFRYRDRGTMATIGRNSAVASVGGRNFSGYFAWALWLGLHLYYLIGFRNRLLVLLNWSWYYLFYERQIRLITREGEAGECR